VLAVKTSFSVLHKHTDRDTVQRYEICASLYITVLPDRV